MKKTLKNENLSEGFCWRCVKSVKFVSAAVFLVCALVLTGCSEKNGIEPDSEDISNEEGSETTGEGAYSTNIVIDADAEVTAMVDGVDEGLCSWTGCGHDSSAIEGDDYAFVPVVYINRNSFNGDKSLTQETVSDDIMSDTSIVINREAVNGVIVNNSDYTIEDSEIVVNADTADGSTTCDFSGLGSALAVYGDSDVTVNNSILQGNGVAGLGLYVDNGAKVLLNNVTMSSKGGTIYSSYVNSPEQKTMVAPPWVLGIMGTSRCSNVMGEKSTLSVVGSQISASNWAVLSVDCGSDAVMNVVDSDMTFTGTDAPVQADGKFDVENPYTSRCGYGTYVIGNASETFLGVTMNVGTYGTIFTGGSATYGNLIAGNSYELPAADGSAHLTYNATEDVQTVINSDTFGFMAHQDTNTCVLDGIRVDSEFTDFLVKSGNDTTITVINGAELNAGNGILLQLMDNDDSTTEFDAENMAFGEIHEEYAGFPTEAVSVSTTNTCVYNVIDTDLEGSIYNGIGWNANELSQDNVKGMQLEVNLSGTSALNGAIASTSCIHAVYEGQIYLRENGITAFNNEDDAEAFARKYQSTGFGQNEYFNIGQVANLVKANGLNNIDVTLADEAVWTVTGTSLVSSVNLSGNAKVIVEKGVVLTVDGREYTEGEYIAGDFGI